MWLCTYINLQRPDTTLWQGRGKKRSVVQDMPKAAAALQGQPPGVHGGCPQRMSMAFALATVQDSGTPSMLTATDTGVLLAS